MDVVNVQADGGEEGEERRAQDERSYVKKGKEK